jgi:hypothetical protein
MEKRTITFDVVERTDVGTDEIQQLACDTWQALSSGRDGACDQPRWINSGSIADASAFTAHRFEGTIDSES